MGLAPGCHRVVELDDHSRVEKPTRCHERLQGVPLHSEHRVSELRVYGKGCKIVINLVMKVPLIAINIPWDRVAVEEWSPDEGSWGQVQRRGFNRALMRW